MRSFVPAVGALLCAGLTHAATVEYTLDDGVANTNQGPPSTFDPDTLWGNYFMAEAGGEVITTVSVAFGPSFPLDTPITIWLLDDPDNDFDPTNAVALTSAEFLHDGTSGNVFVDFPIDPTEVSGGFFVGANAFLMGGEDTPMRVDTDAAGDRSWFFYAPEIDDVINDLASAPFGTRMDNPEFVIFPGAFMLRATGVPAGSPADLNGDGVVDSADLAIMLAAWGGPDADLDDDGSTGASDLAILLAAWG